MILTRMNSLAAVFHAPGLPLTLESLAIPEPGPGEAIVRIRCATICGSDLHSITGRRHCPAPGVLGHEMVGEIEALGPGGAVEFGGEPLGVGDRVTWSMVWSCGDCYYCRRGLVSKCDRLFKFGHEPLGAGNDLSGAYAAHCVLRAGTAIFKVPDHVADLVAAPSNCATATVAAVLRNSGSLAGCSVLVYGAGMLGLTACAMACAEGAAQVIAVETSEARRAKAASFGAQAAVIPDEAAGAVKAATGGRGVDVVLEFAGAPEAAEAAVELLRSGGHLVMAGAVFPSRPVQLAAEQIVRRMLRLTGVYNYQPADLGHALRFLAGAAGRFPFEELVGATFRLAEINEAVAFALREKPARVAVIPG